MKMLALFLSLIALPAFAGETTVKVKGMVCSMCAQGIEKKFKAQGVENVHVDLDKKEVHLSGPDLSDDVIQKLITEAGYNVAGIERK